MLNILKIIKTTRRFGHPSIALLDWNFAENSRSNNWKVVHELCRNGHKWLKCFIKYWNWFSFYDCKKFHKIIHASILPLKHIWSYLELIKLLSNLIFNILSTLFPWLFQYYSSTVLTITISFTSSPHKISFFIKLVICLKYLILELF